MYFGQYPQLRLRRKRQSGWVRRLIAETHVMPGDLIWPCFVKDGTSVKEAVASMPGVYRYSIDLVLKQCAVLVEKNIPAIALFPVIDADLKDERGTLATDPDNLVCKASRAIKENFPDLGVICDVALDPYTSHGHDGIVLNDKVDNDETIEVLAQQALTLARAGCDVVAPSDMMDGRVDHIRRALDRDGYENVMILSYTAKYASSLYGPFRDALGSRSSLGEADKKTYQMDFRNSDEALLEAALDEREGADMLMIKPGLFYLDILTRLNEQTSLPIFAYQVSGEYAMIRSLEQAQGCDHQVLYESLIAFKRAGASAIVTYGAIEIADYLNQMNQ